MHPPGWGWSRVPARSPRHQGGLTRETQLLGAGNGEGSERGAGLRLLSSEPQLIRPSPVVLAEI